MAQVGEPLTRSQLISAARGESWKRRVRVIAVVLGSYLVLSVILLWPLFSHGITSHLPAGTDTQALSWMFSWLPFALFHAHNPFVTTYVSYPSGVNLLNNVSIFTMTFPMMPITTIFGPVTSLNLTSVLSPTLSAGAMYLLCSRFTSRKWIAWIGGLLFGFSPYMMTALGDFHLQLAMIAVPPLLFLALLELFGRQRPTPQKLGVCIAALVIVQFFISTEIDFTLILASLSTVLVALPFMWVHVKRTWPYIVRSLVIGGALTGVILAVPMYYVVAGPQHVSGLVNTTQLYRSDLAGLVYPSVQQIIAPRYFANIASHFAPSESYAYIGLPFLIVVIAAVVILRRNRIVVISFIAATGAFIFSLGGGLVITTTPNLVGNTTNAAGHWLPDRLLESKSIFDNIITSRLMMYSFLFLGIILVIVLETIVNVSKNQRYGIPMALIVALFCLVPLMPRLPMGETATIVDNSVPDGIATLTHTYIPNGAPIITYPYPAFTLDAMMWQSAMDLPFKMPAAWFRVPFSATNTSSSIDPVYVYGTKSTTGETFVLLQKGTPVAITEQLRSSIHQELKSWKIHWVLATFSGTTAMTDRNYLIRLFGRPAHSSSGAYLWHLVS